MFIEKCNDPLIETVGYRSRWTIAGFWHNLRVVSTRISGLRRIAPRSIVARLATGHRIKYCGPAANAVSVADTNLREHAVHKNLAISASFERAVVGREFSPPM